jgi:RNA polymerase subunit RPABC4/transcription elongation factor Spt4
MPYCPECGYEYEDGIKACPDCDVELVDKLSEEHFDGDMVDVFTSFSSAEAGMVKELLFNEGIFSAISNELGSVLLGSTASGAGEMKVFVSESDAEDARELIVDYIEGDPFSDAAEELVCGHCGAVVEEGDEVCVHCSKPLDDEE